jgi:streptogramin lyase
MRLAALPLVLLPFVLAGCSANLVPDDFLFTPAAVQGYVHGGQQPVVGARVYLLAANTTGYGKASISLLNATSTGASDSLGAYVVSDQNGFFTVTGDYTCTAGQQVYALALGGDPGYGGINAAQGMMAVVGNCPGGNFLKTVPFIWINEVSTVAAAYSMSGYATDATHVSAPSNTLAQAGIANAFANAGNLVNLANGVGYSTTPAGNATVPLTQINTIANIIAACVNSNGTSTACSVLFASAKSNGSSGTTPTETATAAINIAHNPGTNVGVLYSILPAQAAFSPALPSNSPPNDYTIALNYTGGGLNQPEGIAVDASGNIWAANFGAVGVTELLSPYAGSTYAPNSPFTGGGLGTSETIAVDTTGNIWVGNYPQNSLSKFDGSGNPITTSAAYTGAGLNKPSSIAFDTSGYVWVADAATGSCMSYFSPAGTAIASIPTATSSGLACSNISSIAVDISGNIWPVSSENSALYEFYGTGNPSAGTLETPSIQNGGIHAPSGVAIDNSSHIWTSNSYKGANSISEFSTNGTTNSGPTGYVGGGLNGPFAVAMDGASNVWLANAFRSLSEFSKNGVPVSPTTGYIGAATFVTPYAIAVDGAGNVWMADQGNDSIIEFVGIATPVVTPIAAGLHNPYLPGSQP